MSVDAPTPDLLLAHALGALPEEDSAAVRRWLLVQTDERGLEAYRTAAEEADRRGALLAYWAERPGRARLERALWRARACFTEHVGLVLGDEAPRPLAFAPLGSTPTATADRTIRVPLGQVVHLLVKSEAPGHLTAFGVDDRGALHVLCDGQIVPASSRIELPGFELEGERDLLEIYLVHSPSAEIPRPAPTDDVTWLAGLLNQIAEHGGASWVRYVFLPEGGKQV
jgi:hypothetical protein